MRATRKVAIKRKLSPEFVLQLQSTHKLFHERMKVIIPAYASQTVEQLKLRGVIYNENATKEDMDAYNRSLVTVYRAPIQHVLWYAEGIPIAYTNRSYAVKVYVYIKDHLKTWKEFASVSLNTTAFMPPQEDLDLLEEFAFNLEQFVEQYNQSDKALMFFKRPGMNRFVASEGRFGNSNSLFGKIHGENYSDLMKRTERKDEYALGKKRQPENIINEDFTDFDAEKLLGAVQRDDQ